MGTTASSADAVPVDESTRTPESSLFVDGNNNYQWPASLYEEARDMGAAAFLTYTFGYVLATARQNNGLKGMDLDDKGHASKDMSSFRLPRSALKRSFTPQEVAQLLDDNKDVLLKSFPNMFENGGARRSLQQLIDRVEKSALKRPLTLAEYDDKHQEHELVYAVAKDDINKRITVSFRGTDSDLAAYSNWTTNAYVAKKSVPLPDYFADKGLDFTDVYLHHGHYDYLFDKTFDDSDDPNQHKFDEIMDDIKPLLQSNKGYKLYLTGHSLGGALSSMISFFLATDASIPKPVTCLNFAATRIGDANYLQACQVLEQHGQLRYCRIVNAQDSVAVIPIINYYHAGFQVKLYKEETTTPEMSFPRIDDSWFNKLSRTWNNSIPVSLNFGYDHSDYRDRIERHKAWLESHDLNEWYRQTEITGFAAVVDKNSTPLTMTSESCW